MQNISGDLLNSDDWRPLKGLFDVSSALVHDSQNDICTTVNNLRFFVLAHPSNCCCFSQFSSDVWHDMSYCADGHHDPCYSQVGLSFLRGGGLLGFWGAYVSDPCYISTCCFSVPEDYGADVSSSLSSMHAILGLDCLLTCKEPNGPADFAERGVV